MIEALIHFVVILAIIAIVAALVFWILGQIPVPAPIAQIIRIAVVVVFVLVLILLLLRFIPGLEIQ